MTEIDKQVIITNIKDRSRYQDTETTKETKTVVNTYLQE